MTHTDQFEKIVNTTVRDICSVSVATASKSEVKRIVLSLVHHIREETEKEMMEKLLKVIENKSTTENVSLLNGIYLDMLDNTPKQ